MTRLLLLLVLSGCAVTDGGPGREVDSVRKPLESQLKNYRHSGPLLNVSIQVFAAVEDPLMDQGVTRLRSAETRYLPVLLRNALMDSGGWGAVRVLPEMDPTAELNITGEILRSDGIELTLRIRAVDAEGRTWLDRVYSDFAVDHEYRREVDFRLDPFEHLYNTVANDINRLRAAYSSAQLERLISITMVRYAAILSPESFGRFLTRDETGVWSLTGLPARNDAMYERAGRIRESEHNFADTVDAAYERFYEAVGQTYTFWRRYSYELEWGNEMLERENDRGPSRSWREIRDGYDTYRESRLNADALRQMTDSFDSEVSPTVAGLEGTVVHLEGSLDTKYHQWRYLLRELFDVERGI